jgi:hypothetical protein
MIVNWYNRVMKPETQKVWNVIRGNLAGFWHRVENVVWPGTPDTDFVIAGTAGKVELKYMQAWPALDTTTTDLGIEAAQRVFLAQYAKNGGRGYVLARVGNDWLLIPGGADLTPTTRNGWIERAIYYDSISPNFDTMIACFTSTTIVGEA